jgi:Fic-DOC domain mobile mystery protein B
MTDPLFGGDDEANTPLTPEEREGLIPSYIAVRTELNEAEQSNIADGSDWALDRIRDVPNEGFLHTLHERMFGKVWKWAGQYRTTARNIGVDAYRISQEVAQLVDDVRYWLEHETYPPDEIAIRFSHRLVAIHPFPSGNGRLSRLAGDLLALRLDRPRFTWGSANLAEPHELRARYVAALRSADEHNIEPLLEFARS